MTQKHNEMMLKGLHPYLFVLKEGSGFQENFLDYSLLLLQTTNAETIRSPNATGPALPALMMSALNKDIL